jgi:dTDP-4-dehydrorhamnose reductase
VQLSTDQVFDGERGGYREGDEARPATVYGESKLAAERAVLASGGEELVLRAALVLAPSRDGRSGALDMVRGAEAGEEVRLFADEWRAPISALDLARVIDEALRRRATGVLHVAGPERVSRLELGERIAAAFARPDGAPRLVSAARAQSGMRRPRDVSLAIERLEREGYPRPAPLAFALEELRALTAGPRAA